MHVYSGSKKTNAELKPNKRQLFTAHLYSFNLTGKAPQHAYATSPTTMQHHQWHSPSNVHRVVTLPEGRIATRRGGGEVSRQNARADRCCEGSSSACFRSEERQGGGWRVLPIGGHGCNAPRRGRGAVLGGERRSEYWRERGGSWWPRGQSTCVREVEAGGRVVRVLVREWRTCERGGSWWLEESRVLVREVELVAKWSEYGRIEGGRHESVGVLARSARC